MRESKDPVTTSNVPGMLSPQPPAESPGKGAAMSRNLLLLESIKGHLALLAQKHPKKAQSPVALKTKRYVNTCLRQASHARAA